MNNSGSSWLVTCACALLLGIPASAQASVITPAGVTGTGTYTNSASLIINGVVPAQGSVWTGGTNVYWSGTAPTFTVDLGQVHTVDDVLVSIDNNDSYQIDSSLDSGSWSPLFTVLAGYGEIGSGMDTMSTDSTHGQYIIGIDFASTAARYIRISATGGDNSYAIGELQTSGSVVPEPGTLLLLGGGLLLAAVRRSRR